jgi:uncharacterized protein (DUF302 family)
MHRLIYTAILILVPFFANAQSVSQRDGWVVLPTAHSFKELIAHTRSAIKQAPIAIVSQASASSGAKNQGFEILGNRVIGVYRNDYARRMLAASVPAGIEAPIRLYLTENLDKTATLSYKTPTTVFAPYMSEGGHDLETLAKELDDILQNIAQTATKNP